MNGLPRFLTLAALLGCSTSDEVLAWEMPSDAGSTLIPESRPPPIDAAAPASCPGIPLGTTRHATINGNTQAGSAAQESPTCGGGTSKDTVYAITSPVQGQARILLDAAFDALLYVRTSCADPSTEVACESVPLGGGKAELRLPMTKDQTAYVVVDGRAGRSGSFALDVTIEPTSCGDGLAQYPEQCDDGNRLAGDGCSPTCALETPLSAAGVCPGATFTLSGKVSFAGDTTLLKNTAGSTGCGGGSAKDQVYSITPVASGALTAELHAGFDALLHARRECFTSQTEVDCRESTAPNVPIRMTFPVVAQQTYSIFADATSSSAGGRYTLDVTLSPATCGNGTLEAPEQCDDANTTPGDGCSAACQLEPLPPGIDTCPGAAINFTGNQFRTTASTTSLTPGTENCASSSHNDAVYTFVAPFDAWLTAKARGAFNLSLDLRTNCIPASLASSGSIACGKAWNGDDEEKIAGPVAAGSTYYLVVSGENGNANGDGPFTLEAELAPSICGNGVTEGGEACDDGGHAAGDGCNPSCQLEPTPTTGTTCATAEDIPLTGSGVFYAQVGGGNWNLLSDGAFSAPCGATGGKEAYYKVTPPIDGVLVADVDATYNITPGVRLSCPHRGSGFLTCSNRSLGPGAERLAFAVKAGTPYWLILDAPPTQHGSYTMKLSLQRESCGDGVVSGAEQCDDGNVAPGDGCSATCTLEHLASVDQCPGTTVFLTSAAPQRILTISTTDLDASQGGTCGGSDRDGVVAVISDVGGTLLAQLASTWPAVFYARSSCTDSTSELGCDDADPAKPSDTLRELSLEVKPNLPVYLFVDGLPGASGPATLSLTVSP